MAAITTAVALGGLAISGYGAYTSYQSGQEQAELAAQGAALGNAQGQAVQQASIEQADITREQEALRRQEAANATVRSRRNVIRQGQIARSQAVTNAANSGSLQSSSLQGGLSQITGSEGANLVSLNEAFLNGETNFDLNEELVNSQERLNVTTGTINQQQASLGTLQANAQGSSQFGQTLFGIGQGITQNAATISRVGQTVLT